MDVRSCTNCRFFNRWGLAVVTLDEDDQPAICKRGVWSFKPGMLDEELLEKLESAAKCEYYTSRTGGSNGVHTITLPDGRVERERGGEGGSGQEGEPETEEGG